MEKQSVKLNMCIESDIYLKEKTEKLLNWYAEHKRTLPWRTDPSPYHVWLSEIMLQQTRVEAVKDYYARFLKEIPDIATLAETEEDQEIGLQGISNLDTNEGMLFVFDSPDEISF